jgi:hypothetical protein
VVVLVLVVLVVLVALVVQVSVVDQAMNRQHHTVVEDMELAKLVVVEQVMSRQHHTVAVDTEPELELEVLVLVVHHTNHQQVMVLVLVLVSVLEEAKDMVLPHHHSVHKVLDKHIQLMLKVFTKIQTHKSSAVQLQVVYKPIHKTLKFDFFNHHLFHLQAHS